MIRNPKAFEVWSARSHNGHHVITELEMFPLPWRAHLFVNLELRAQYGMIIPALHEPADKTFEKPAW